MPRNVRLIHYDFKDMSGERRFCDMSSICPRSTLFLQHPTPISNRRETVMGETPQTIKVAEEAQMASWGRAHRRSGGRAAMNAGAGMGRNLWSERMFHSEYPPLATRSPQLYPAFRPATRGSGSCKLWVELLLEKGAINVIHENGLLRTPSNSS